MRPKVHVDAAMDGRLTEWMYATVVMRYNSEGRVTGAARIAHAVKESKTIFRRIWTGRKGAHREMELALFRVYFGGAPARGRRPRALASASAAYLVHGGVRLDPDDPAPPSG